MEQDTDFKKNSIAFQVGHEMAVAMGWVGPTADERRKIDQLHREIEQRRDVAASVIPASIRRLDSLTDPALRAVLDHHSRMHAGCRWTCSGCDQGCSCDSAEWPCSTVGVVAELAGVDLTDADLFRRPADGSLDLEAAR